MFKNWFCRDLHCFFAKSVLSRFTHFCVEKNDKYEVWNQRPCEMLTRPPASSAGQRRNWRPFLPFHRCSSSPTLNCSHCAVGRLYVELVGSTRGRGKHSESCIFLLNQVATSLSDVKLKQWWQCSKSVDDGWQ